MPSLGRDHLRREDQRGSYVCFGDAIVIAHILDARTTAQVAHNYLDKHTCTGDDRPAGYDRRINADVCVPVELVGVIHSPTIMTRGRRRLEHLSLERERA